MRCITLLACCAALVALDIDSERFRHQWYDQGAEITRYALQQSRYGAVREGDAVLIVVTEPLSTEQQVKSDDPEAADAVRGIKLNATRTFLTGIYPYSVMTTVLQPLPELPRALKITTSVQEWCGHVFEQWNRREAGWQRRLFSYFQSEGDIDESLPRVWLEDELWLRLRLDPASLPTGAITVVPGAVHRRFEHAPAEPARAEAGFEPLEGGLRRYRLVYAEIDRELHIDFEVAFPHRIQAWRERRGEEQTTARATHRIMDPYWRHNRAGDEALRERLGLGR